MWLPPPDFTVVRLKRDPGFCHYRCARSQIFRITEPFWHFNDPPKWVNYYREYSQHKPSTGLCAVFCAIDALQITEVYLSGFDALLDQQPLAGHDTRAELAALNGLGLKVHDVRGLA